MDFIQDSNNLYPLEDAIYHNSLDLVKFFINTNKIDYSLKIPIVNNNEEEEEEEEFEKKLKNDKYTTYLHLAIQSGHFEIIKEFLDKNLIDINITNSDGDTPLIEACRFGNLDCILTLFENDKLDFNHCNNDGDDAVEVLGGMKTKEPIKDKNEYLMIIQDYL